MVIDDTDIVTRIIKVGNRKNIYERR